MLVLMPFLQVRVACTAHFSNRPKVAVADDSRAEKASQFHIKNFHC